MMGYRLCQAMEMGDRWSHSDFRTVFATLTLCVLCATRTTSSTYSVPYVCVRYGAQDGGTLTPLVMILRAGP